MVPEARGDDVQRHPRSERKRCHRVAQHVKRADGDASRLPQRREGAPQPLGANRRADLVAEDKILVLVGVANERCFSNCRSRWSRSACTVPSSRRKPRAPLIARLNRAVAHRGAGRFGGHPRLLVLGRSVSQATALGGVRFRGKGIASRRRPA
jgi:hypothetical protein